MTLKLSLETYEMTYGQLIDFADIARASGVDRNAPVEQVEDPQVPNIVERFELDVVQVPTSNVIIDASTAADYARALASIIHNEGDARAELETLREIYEALTSRI
ncbi:hypothetical protein [Lysinibacter cavernae]|uniref:Uncharacterized protein n=1 Tax=Lysinibacter cavernae TaxID=1640652 RepID=A0A7X5QYY3_9MICO|nr:hypothetical protein [Lysinibacter cavernae]NIH52563.1 hypothetical protein [Lysinibacter cavernae]